MDEYLSTINLLSSMRLFFVSILCWTRRGHYDKNEMILHQKTQRDNRNGLKKKANFFPFSFTPFGQGEKNALLS